jgi:hypothetical protein
MNWIIAWAGDLSYNAQECSLPIGFSALFNILSGVCLRSWQSKGFARKLSSHNSHICAHFDFMYTLLRGTAQRETLMKWNNLDAAEATKLVSAR